MDSVWYNFPCPGWGSHWQKSHKGQVKMLNKLSGVFTLSEFGLQILIFLYELSIGTFTCLLCDHYLRSVENIQNLVVRSALLRLSAFTTSFPTYTYRFTELDEHLFYYRYTACTTLRCRVPNVFRRNVSKFWSSNSE